MLTSPKSTITSVQFGLFSSATIKSLSVLHIIHPETFENGIPKDSGLADPRMGTSDYKILCSTCGKNAQDCQGHFGHIELTKPVFHIGYINKIKKVLECICFYCSSIKVQEKKESGAKESGTKESGIKENATNENITNNNELIEEINKTDNAPVSFFALRHRLNKVWTLCKTKNVCDACGNKQPLIRKEGLNLLAFMKATDADGKILLSPEKVLQILKKISDEDISRLGFSIIHSRPEYMILTTLIVAPPAARPAIQMDGLRGEDDLTHKYADIIKANINLRRYESEGAPTHILRDYEQLLQFHVATLIDNDISGQPQALQKSGRPLKSLSARLKGKEGRLRYNLMGKRVDFSARTVITPDPNISLVEVGVPLTIAMIHTYNECVNALNIDNLQKLVNTGPNTHPGANYVIRTDGQRIDLRFNRNDIQLQEGYVVERHLQDGDIVLFNRQPSLHKMSMMAHKVRVMNKKTFRLNLSVTTPYNADFDGDEMNLHAPQSLLCKSELEELAFVSKQIVSPQSNRPVMGIVQDTLIGVRRLTLDDVFFEEREAMQVFYASGIQEYNKMKTRFLQDDYEIEEESNNANYSFNAHENLNSRTIKTINKETKYNNNKCLIPKPTILRPKKLYTGKQIFSWSLPCINYVGMSTDEKKVLIVDGILHTGVIDKKSVGNSEGGIILIIFNDFGGDTCTSFFDITQKIVNNYNTNISSFSIGIGDTIASKELKKEINKSINEAREEVNNLITDPSTLTRLPGMTLRETFESQINVYLNKARNVSGKSAQKYLSSHNNVKQMVLAGSKGSLINISQMTACVGQQNVEGKRIPFGFRNRTLPHFAKDDYGPTSRGFVENSYLTGLTPEEFYFHAMGGREGLIDTAVKTAETGYIQRRLVKAMEDLKIEYDASVRSATGNVLQFCYGDDGFRGESIERVKNTKVKNIGDKSFENISLPLHKISDDVIQSIKENKIAYEKELQNNSDIQNYFPFNLNRIFWNVKRCIPFFMSDITYRYLQKRKSEIINYVKQTLTPHKTMNYIYYQKIMLHIDSFFSMSNILHSNISKIHLKKIIEIFKDKFVSGLALQNEMVGTLSAQSVGEPATQMTLNTFHFAGVASTVTLGVPRLKEIINIAKTMKTPSLRIELKKPFCDSLVSAKQVQVEIEHTTLKDVIDYVQIIYDPLIEDTIVNEDKEFVSMYYAFPDEENSSNQSLYVIRMVVNREKLIGRGLKMCTIVEMIKKKGMSVICSDENALNLVLRIRTNEREEEHNIEIMKRLMEMCLAGYKNIKKVFVIEEKINKEMEVFTKETITKIRSNENVNVNANVNDDVDSVYNSKYTNEDSDNEDHSVTYVLQTEGVNLRDLLCNEKIKSNKLYSNNIIEVYEVLGIEAAREVILRELRSVIENEGYVNYRHLSLLSDVMTVRGYLTGITRHGVNKGEKSALMRCSFEETVEILLEAALVSEKSQSKEVTDSIILGQVVPIGTGCVELYLNKDMLLDAVPIAQKSEYNFDFEKGEYGTPSVMTPVSEEQGMYSEIFSPLRENEYIMNRDTGNTNYSPTYSPSFSPTYSPTYSPSHAPSFTPSHVPSHAPSFTPSHVPSFSPSRKPVYSPTKSYKNIQRPSNAYIPKTKQDANQSSYQSPSFAYNPTNPSMSPINTMYKPTSPGYSPTSPSYNVMSPSYLSFCESKKKSDKKKEDDKKKEE
ncbi:DNA-directed RNA polymerase II core subunit rpo21 [Binucleata daphniae]